MPLLKHAIKKARQDKLRTARNRLTKERLHDAIKVVEDGSTGKIKADLPAALKEAYKRIDKAAKQNLLHKNNAAHKKSRLARLTKAAATSK